jgi:hypothetical protein
VWHTTQAQMELGARFALLRELHPHTGTTTPLSTKLLAPRRAWQQQILEAKYHAKLFPHSFLSPLFPTAFAHLVRHSFELKTFSREKLFPSPFPRQAVKSSVLFCHESCLFPSKRLALRHLAVFKCLPPKPLCHRIGFWTSACTVGCDADARPAPNATLLSGRPRSPETLDMSVLV